MKKPWLPSYDKEVPTTISYPEIPVYTFFDEMAQKYPDLPCVTFRTQQINYKELHDLMNSLANALISLGIKSRTKSKSSFTLQL